jgi:transcriptional regulator with XRE-family HTH domain
MVVSGMEVGDRLRQVRERLKISQAQLAEKVGVHPTTVTLWENHKNRRQISDEHLQQIAKALGVQLSELTGGVDPEQIETSLARLNVVEKVLVDTFRRLPNHVQTLQLAQLIECERVSRLQDTAGKQPGVQS